DRHKDFRAELRVLVTECVILPPFGARIDPRQRVPPRTARRITGPQSFRSTASGPRKSAPPTNRHPTSAQSDLACLRRRDPLPRCVARGEWIGPSITYVKATGRLAPDDRFDALDGVDVADQIILADSEHGSIPGQMIEQRW